MAGLRVGSDEPVRVIWYPAAPGAKVFEGPCGFCSFNYTEQGWDKEGHREFLCNPDLWPGWGWDTDGIPFDGIGEVFSACPDYYRGDDLWHYPGDHYCGTPATALDGARAPGAVGIFVGPDGASECCLGPFGGPGAGVGDAEEEFALVTPVSVTRMAAPLWAGAKLSGDGGTPQVIHGNTSTRLTIWSDPNVTSFAFDGYQKDLWWDSGNPYVLTSPVSGFGLLMGSLDSVNDGTPYLLTIWIQEAVSGTVLAVGQAYGPDLGGISGCKANFCLPAFINTGLGYEMWVSYQPIGGPMPDITVGGNTDAFAIQLTAPVNVLGGETGVCNEIVQIGSFGPGAPQLCDKNPTECYCPTFEAAPGPGGGVGGILEEVGEPAPGPGAGVGGMLEEVGEPAPGPGGGVGAILEEIGEPAPGPGGGVGGAVEVWTPAEPIPGATCAAAGEFALPGGPFPYVLPSGIGNHQWFHLTVVPGQTYAVQIVNSGVINAGVHFWRGASCAGLSANGTIAAAAGSHCLTFVAATPDEWLDVFHANGGTSTYTLQVGAAGSACPL